MSQHDLDIANQAGAAFRADLNSALQAIATNQSGSVEPNPSYEYQLWADTGNGLLKMRNSTNTAWVTLGLLGVPNLGFIAPGTISFHAKNVAPAGYLKCNGGAVSRTTYANLFAEIGTTFGIGDGSTTFNLPELRGEFPRFWDDSRGIDAARVFGSAQVQQLLSHQHTTLTPPFVGSEVFVGSAVLVGTGTANDYYPRNTSLVGGSENRPRNIALLGIIKY